MYAKENDMPNEETGGPFVQVATFCHTALLEQNSQQLTIVRLIDRQPVQIPKLPANFKMNLPEGTSLPVPPTQVTLVLVLKSGFYKGRATISISPKSPTGKSLPVASFPVLFEGDERGVQIIMPMAIVLQEEGLYWFEVGVGNPPMLLTKVPLRTLHQEVQIQPLGSPTGR
jgi:hypothetical protein